MSKTIVVLILDGWGIGQNNTTNPIYMAQLKTIEYIKSHYPCGALEASGIAVGLPWGEPGNSKVGHLTIGAGRTITSDEVPANTLSDVLASHGKFQIRIAETERYRHITYFFSGRKNEPNKNEYRILVPSQNRAHPDTHPALMTEEIGKRVIQAIEEGIDCVFSTIAAPDVIAHTGNFNAGIAACRAVDETIGAIVQTARAKNAAIIIVGDHGNIEQMRDQKTGVPETKHNLNPVPFYLIDPARERKKDARQIVESEGQTVGVLADVAPTVLELMGIAQPKDMTGKSLLNKLK